MFWLIIPWTICLVLEVIMLQRNGVISDEGFEALYPKLPGNL